MAANNKKCWSVDLRVQSSEELLTWCLDREGVDRMLVVVRSPRELERLPARLFGTNVLEDFAASAWPGTELIGHSARVFVVKFDQSIAEVILRTQPDLRKWLHASNPPLPEDICLFDSNADSPTLITVSHEELCWIIAERKPKLAGIRETSVRVEELFWEGQYFCRPWTKGK
ncbi:MAG TPA: hypothetical protein VFR78_01330 [Pyrinomonadaceae bacterium]|nr:hypothetical protein [Pyrinomonadaceae bacterium]